MLRNLLLKILLRLLSIPPVEGTIDIKKEREFFGGIYPIREFRNFMARRDLEILQILGGGVSREEYLFWLGHRNELQLLLYEAKKDFKIVEDERRNKQKVEKK